MRRVIIGLLLSSLFACASLPYEPVLTLEDVDYWEKHQRYTRAMSILDQLRPSDVDPDVLASRKSALKKRIDETERQALEKSNRLLAEGRLIAAVQHINDALYQIPDNQRLVDRRDEIIEEREARRRDLQRHVFFKSAKSHLSSQKLYRQLAEQYKDDQESRHLLKQTRQQVLELNNSLIELARYYIQQKRFRQARESLLMANQLLPDPETQVLLDSIDKNNQVVRGEGWSQTQAFRAAEKKLGSGDLMAARVEVNGFVAKYPGTSQAIDLEGRLERQIDAKIEVGLEQGRREYQKRNIQQALEIWRPLLLLKPGHPEVKANIDRAQRVHDKLEKLTEEIDAQ